MLFAPGTAAGDACTKQVWEQQHLQTSHLAQGMSQEGARSRADTTNPEPQNVEDHLQMKMDTLHLNKHFLRLLEKYNREKKITKKCTWHSFSYIDIAHAIQMLWRKSNHLLFQWLSTEQWQQLPCCLSTLFSKKTGMLLLWFTRKKRFTLPQKVNKESIYKCICLFCKYRALWLTSCKSATLAF